MCDVKKQFTNALIKILEFKHKQTVEHSIRVMRISNNFSKYIRCNPDEIETLKYSAILHDIGKAVIPKQILEKKKDYLYRSLK